MWRNHTAQRRCLTLYIATLLLPGGWAHTVIFLSRSLIPLITVHCKTCYLQMDEQTKKQGAWLLLRCSQAPNEPMCLTLPLSISFENVRMEQMHNSFIVTIYKDSWHLCQPFVSFTNSSLHQLLQRWILICPTSVQAARRRQICKQRRWREIGLID